MEQNVDPNTVFQSIMVVQGIVSGRIGLPFQCLGLVSFVPLTHFLKHVFGVRDMLNAQFICLQELFEA